MPFTCAGARARPARARSKTYPAALAAWGLLLAAACATAGSERPETPAFEDVGKVALVRWNERRAGQRAKDPLDGLAESLAARGVATRAIEVGPRAPDSTAALERLWAAVEGRIRAAPPYEPRGSSPQALGSGAAKLVRELGVDAVALYLRLDRYRMLPRTDPPPPDFAPPSAIVPPPGGDPLQRSRYQPVAAVAVVGREGGLVWFDWGPRDEAADVPGPVNAAEALEEVVRLLTGEPPPDER